MLASLGAGAHNPLALTMLAMKKGLYGLPFLCLHTVVLYSYGALIHGSQQSSAGKMAVS